MGVQHTSRRSATVWTTYTVILNTQKMISLSNLRAPTGGQTMKEVQVSQSMYQDTATLHQPGMISLRDCGEDERAVEKWMA